MPKKSLKITTKSAKEEKSSIKSSFTIEKLYNTSVSKVWNALTQLNEIRQWFSNLSNFKAQIGFEFSFLEGRDQDHLYNHLCKVTEVIPFKKLAYSWQYEGYDGYSEVIFELTDMGNKTKLTLTHTGLDTFPQIDDFKAENFAEGWTSITDSTLKNYVEYKKIIVFNMVSIDGFFEGPKGFGDLDWHNVDSEFNEFAINQLQTIDTLMFGRKTYDLMASYWPTPAGLKDSPTVAKLMNDLPKVVFSKSLKEATWSNSSIISDNIEDELSKLRENATKDLFIFGSGKLTNTLLNLGLIDELRLIIAPVILGAGTPMFLSNKIDVQLFQARTFKNSNVLLYYKVLRK